MVHDTRGTQSALSTGALDVSMDAFLTPLVSFTLHFNPQFPASKREGGNREILG